LIEYGGPIELVSHGWASAFSMPAINSEMQKTMITKTISTAVNA
jgi:hypothetical protein